MTARHPLGNMTVFYQVPVVPFKINFATVFKTFAQIVIYWRRPCRVKQKKDIICLLNSQTKERKKFQNLCVARLSSNRD